MMILGVEWSLLSSNVHILTAKFSAGSLLLRRLAPVALSMARLRVLPPSGIAFLALIGHLDSDMIQEKAAASKTRTNAAAKQD